MNLKELKKMIESLLSKEPIRYKNEAYFRLQGIKETVEFVEDDICKEQNSIILSNKKLWQDIKKLLELRWKSVMFVEYKKMCSLF